MDENQNLHYCDYFGISVIKNAAMERLLDERSRFHENQLAALQKSIPLLYDAVRCSVSFADNAAFACS